MSDELSIPPGSLWVSHETRCSYEILDEPSQYGPDMILAVIYTSPWRARGRYRSCPLVGDRIYLRRDDFVGGRIERMLESVRVRCVEGDFQGSIDGPASNSWTPEPFKCPNCGGQLEREPKQREEGEA